MTGKRLRSSELACLLDAAGEEPVVLEKNGKRYRLVEEAADDIWAGYDPTQVKAALQDSHGALADVDGGELLKDIRAVRGQNSPGRPA